MHVQVDEAGHAGLVFQVDDGGTGRGGIAFFHAQDFLAVDDYRALGLHFLRTHVDEPGALQRHRGGGKRAGGGEQGGGGNRLQKVGQFGHVGSPVGWNVGECRGQHRRVH